MDRFLIGELKPGQTISRQVVERWNESMAHLSPNTRINRLCVLRRFCRYLSHFDADTCIVHQSFSPSSLSDLRRRFFQENLNADGQRNVSQEWLRASSILITTHR
ncbi:MAG TPA: hypothetical protein VH595_15910 [Verrucomicrobiae bacterium]|nr:hypothetical protein [Verrucomicrobiae bacterium]